ncbi:MAG: type I 3-dehydroquinate dehydratase [Planctomycetes bacterium]|nr:type I 3-dehydroquinate dehydratase [Planctomycetota bacterium]
MICITIAQESRHLLLADMLNAAAMGADLLEVRLDCLEKAPNFGDMLKAKRLPLLFSCRRQQDGGNWQGTEDERLMLLRQAIMSKADYVEIEHDIADKIRPFPGCKRVISYTNTDKMPSAIADIYEDMLAMQPDVIKLTVRARTPEEAWPLVQILGRPKAPTVVTGLGRRGVMLAILGKKIGAPWTCAALERGMEAFPGQPTIRDLLDVYHYREIGKSTRLVGVTGIGEREFFTTGLMNAAFAHLQLPHRVLPLQVGNLKMFRKVIDIVKLQGVTMEESFYTHVHETATLDESARAPVRAADLMRPGDDGTWIGSNTLGSWAIHVLESTLRLRDPDKDPPLNGRVAMLAGVGPMAAMLAHGLKERGAALIFASKDRAEAGRLAQAFGGRQVAWEGIYTTIHDVLIISRDPTTSDEETMESVPIHPGYLRPTMTVLDLSLLPRYTPFLLEAKQRGCSIVSPKSLLIEQARHHVKLMTDQDVDPEILREKLTTWLDEGEDGMD